MGASWEQVGTKIGLGWDEVEKLFIALQEPRTMTELKELYQWSNTTKFRAKYVSPLIDAQFVGMVLPNKPTNPNSLQMMVRHYSLMRLVIRIQVVWWKRFITCLKNLVKKRSVLR